LIVRPRRTTPVLHPRSLVHTWTECRPPALDRVASEPLGCSSINLAEVLVGPGRHGRLSAAQAAVEELEVEEIPLGTDTAARLATMRAEVGLELRACCVLVAAQEAAARAILTFDDALARAAEGSGFETV
jgi:hypothetical protein